MLHRLYALACYAVFLASFAWAVGFIGDFGVAKTIDRPRGAGDWAALAVDVALLALFAVQHSVMARPAFKRWWTRFVPQPLERSTYVLAASLALLVLFALWQPIPGYLWDRRGTPAGAMLLGLYAFGWLLTLAATFMIDHFELFGFAQAWRRARPVDEGDELREVWLYRFVRHPIMLGFLVTFWATPAMSIGHLLFAGLSTAYIVLGTALEERDLVAAFGERYRRYRRRVPMLLPWPKRRP
jgi:protein-S-isoprenylcysteine O-methyltransferase Ste14